MAIPALVLGVFVLVIVSLIFCIIAKPKIPIPCTALQVRISYVIPPLIGVLFLIVTAQIGPWTAIKSGIVGDDKLKPYAILILIFGLSMICTALDFTGALSWFAFHLVARFVNTRLRLLTLVFLLSTFMGIFSSSHSVVLAIAPLVLYVTQFAKISAQPYLFAAFYAANLASLFLIIGNPTNIIIGTAFDISFSDFAQFMFLPAVVTIVTCYIVLLLRFHKDMGLTKTELFCCRQPQVRFSTPFQATSLPTSPSTFTTGLVNNSTSQGSIAVEDDPDASQLTTTDPSRIYLPRLDPSSELKDKFGAVFHGLVLAISLVLMGVSSFISDSIQLWQIALPACAISLLYCLIAYPFLPRAMRDKRTKEKKQQKVPSSVDEYSNDGSPTTKEVLASNGMIITVPMTKEEIEGQRRRDGAAPQENNLDEIDQVVPTSEIVDQVADDDLGDSAHKELCFYNIIMQFPIEVCCFLALMFCLVNALLLTGWVEETAYFVLSLIGGRNSLATEVENPLASRRIVIIIILSLITLGLGNLLSAQPASIFMTRLLISLDEIVHQYQIEAKLLPATGLNKDYQATMVYAAIAATNYCGLCTLIGSIAGIMFASIVNTKVARQEEEYKLKLDQLLREQNRVDPKYYLRLQQERLPGTQGIAAGVYSYNGPRRLADIFSDNYEEDDRDKKRQFQLAATEQLSPELQKQLPVYFDDTITYGRFFSKGMFVLPGIIVAAGLSVWVASFYAPGVNLSL